MGSEKHPIHVFIDNSNIFGGAQKVVQSYEPHVPWPAIRVYLKSFVSLIEGGRPTVTRIFAGSVPPGNEDLWKYARAAGYNTDLLRRVEADDGRLVEQGVDELLHLKIANTLLDRDGKETLVLVTGDGRVSKFSTGFTLQAERALRKGWDVEVWSWSRQLSRKFGRLTLPQGTHLTTRHLDPFYFSITYVKRGSYYDEDGKAVILADRVVSPLPTGLKNK